MPITAPEQQPATAGNGTPGIDSGPLRDRVRRFEIQQIRRAIEQAGGDRRVAAGRLGIGLSSLYRKLGEAHAQDGGEPLIPAPRRGPHAPAPPADA